MQTPESSHNPEPIKHYGGVEQPSGTHLNELTPDQAIKSLQLLKAKTEADTAEYQKRLVLHQFRPCKLYPVIIYHDGMRWVCSLGAVSDALREYLPAAALGESGVEGYGEYPEQAMLNFDAMWIGKLAEDIASADDDEDDCGDDE